MDPTGPSRLRLLSWSTHLATVGGGSADAEPDVTVLVGRNGAGKSVLVDVLHRARTLASGEPISVSSSVATDWFLLRDDGSHVGLLYTAVLSDQDGHVGPLFESLGKGATGGGEPLVVYRVAQSPAETVGLRGPPRSGVAVLAQPDVAPMEAAPLRVFFQGLRVVEVGSVRRHARQQHFFVWRDPEPTHPPTDLTLPDGTVVAATPADRTWKGPVAEARLVSLYRLLLEAKLGDPGRLEVLGHVLSRCGVPSRLEISVTNTTETSFATISLDGINLAHHSDGTLRLVELAAFATEPACTALVIEEPELFLHPGLLARVLNELKSFASSGQVILSTHSPQVVSWALPRQLRLVAWSDDEGKRGPLARGLTPEEARRIGTFLENEGTLGEYVFEGGLGEE